MNRPETPAALPNAVAGTPMPSLDAIKWSAEGLVPAVVQDVENGDVLMMAWMDASALRRTLETGQTHFYSRSRRAAWHKGETSGHVQEVVSVHVDCDADVVLVKARQVGGACHEGYRTCFFRRLGPDGRPEITEAPVFAADAVYKNTADAHPTPMPRLEGAND